jgi:hypothetical protein
MLAPGPAQRLGYLFSLVNDAAANTPERPVTAAAIPDL